MSRVETNDYYRRIAKAIAFIEANLTNSISLDQIAVEAFFSKFHFSRLFSAITGVTAGEYLRKRRITNSAKLLVDTTISILSIALKFQFESQEAYTRSFKSVYKTTPKKYRQKGLHQIAFGREMLTDKKLDHLKKQNSILPKIVEFKGVNLVGVQTKTSLSKNNIIEMWNEFLIRIKEISNRVEDQFYEINPYDSNFRTEHFTKEYQFTKWATIEISEKSTAPKGMKLYQLNKGIYALFTHKGLIKDIQLTYEYVYGTWLISSIYELDQRDEFEFYGDKYLGPFHPNSEMEIGIPIKIKENGNN